MIEQRHLWDETKHKIFNPTGNEGDYFESASDYYVQYFFEMPSGNFLYVGRGMVQNYPTYSHPDEYSVYLFLVGPDGDVLDSHSFGNDWVHITTPWASWPTNILLFGEYQAFRIGDGAVVNGWAKNPTTGHSAHAFIYVTEDGSSLSLDWSYDDIVPDPGVHDFGERVPGIAHGCAHVVGSQATILTGWIPNKDHVFYTLDVASGSPVLTKKTMMRAVFSSALPDLDLDSRYQLGGIYRLSEDLVLLAFDANETRSVSGGYRHVRLSLINITTGVELDHSRVLRHFQITGPSDDEERAVVLSAYGTSAAGDNYIFEASNGTFALYLAYYPFCPQGSNNCWIGNVKVVRLLFDVDGSTLTSPADVGTADLTFFDPPFTEASNNAWGYWPYMMRPYRDESSYYLAYNNFNAPVSRFSLQDHAHLESYQQVLPEAGDVYESGNVQIMPVSPRPGTISISGMVAWTEGWGGSSYEGPGQNDHLFVLFPRVIEEHIEGRLRSRILVFGRAR